MATKKVSRKKVSKKKISKKKVSKKKAVNKKSKAKKKTATVKKKAKVSAKKKSKAKKKAVGKKASTKKKVTKKKVIKTAEKKTLATKGLAKGKAIPKFSLPATGEQSISKSSLKGSKVVLFFYPKDATPGCTIEAHDFSRLKKKFESLNTVVYGISRDSMKSHDKFKEKQGYTIDLISDEEEELCSIFSTVKMKNLYGRKYRGIDRSTFVLDEKGRLLQEWRSVKVKGHAEEVLAYIKSL